MAEVVNYHYRGACLRLPNSLRDDIRFLEGDFKLDFLLGKIRIREDLPYRVCWNDILKSGTIGVEFLSRPSKMNARADRFLVHMAHRPRLEARDPLDPNRAVFLNVNDVSETGLLVQTSLTNKHIMPGMRLLNSKLIIPGQETLTLDLSIENTRRGVSEDSFLLGLSVSNDRTKFKQALRAYLSEIAPMSRASEDHLAKLSDAGLLAKKIKQAVSYRTIECHADYESVLKLRFSGYGKHNKIRVGTTWKQQGEGLDREGVIVGGYLSGNLVCSMEVRFGNDTIPLRCEQLNGGQPIPGIDRNRIVEVNKLVIHPKLQGSDVVLGMMQRVHAIVITRGQFDVLLAATDQLAPLYQRIGAEKIGLRVPHPHLVDEYLNFMLVKREVYHDGLRFNPHAWNTIYQNIHEHFSSLGMAQEKRSTLMRKLMIQASKIFAELERRFRVKKSTSKSKSTGHTKASNASQLGAQRAGFIDPKWTRQEILATVMHPYVVAASEMIGPDKVDSILDAIGIGRDYIQSPVNWLSIAFHDEFLDRFAVFGDPAVLSVNAGKRSLAKDIQGVNYYFLKHFMSLHLVFQHMTRVGQKFNRTRTYDLVKSKKNGVTIALGSTAPALLPRRRESCMNWQASFEALIHLMTNKQGRVAKTSCVYDGHAACTYELEWESAVLRSRLLLAGMLLVVMGGSAALSSYIVHGFSNQVFVGVCAGGLSLLVWLLNQFRQESVRFKMAAREFEGFQKQAGEKYSELQEAKNRVDEMYREARILEQTSRDIQSNKSLHDILSATLKGVCHNFSFDRSFVMLINENRDLLQTAAIAGVDANADLLWRFSVDVSRQRDNAALLSSVYLTGQPIVINDIDAHLFQLNKASQEIIQTLGSQGFVIVQIPGRETHWGVLVADLQAKKHHLGQRDIKVLERLAQQLGVALDKRSDFEREERLRNYFQRYVPSAVVAESLGQHAPVLGGQMRTVVAMFVDIRGFTHLASTLTPTATVNYLNRFFSILEPTVSAFGGVVDKYLGDGALVTWGALGGAKSEPEKAVQAAVKLLERIEELNLSDPDSGQPRLEVGIGLHVGPAIVGNVGSEERVEFTCIGMTINYASRLEGLCKHLSCSIVASSAMGLHRGNGWQEVSGLSVRGISGTQTVWVYRQTGAGAPIPVNERTVA